MTFFHFRAQQSNIVRKSFLSKTSQVQEQIQLLEP